ncbi:MAG: hypothetical protein H5U40_05020, partial [Polyangiaceae bacterium]|nr:hypothetical protein [Polyangiaceae bacterium]
MAGIIGIGWRIIARMVSLVGGVSLVSSGCGSEAREPTSVEGVPAAHSSAPASRIDRASVFFVGHSLVNFQMPAMTAAIAESLGAQMTWDAQVQIGAALKVNWENHAAADGTDARIALPTGRYDVLVMTEAVSLDDMIRWMDPPLYGEY